MPIFQGFTFTIVWNGAEEIAGQARNDGGGDCNDEEELPFTEMGPFLRVILLAMTLRVSLFTVISGVNFFFFIFTFRMGGYLHFNAPTPPSHIPQYAVEQYGLFRSYLLAHLLLTKKLAIAPF